MAYDAQSESFLTAGIYSRADAEYARYLISAPVTDDEMHAWTPDGWCTTYEFILSPHGDSVAEDPHPNADKLVVVSDGYLLQNVSGIRARVVNRLDRKGYDVTKCASIAEHIFVNTHARIVGPFSVKTGQIVYINDSELQLAPLTGQFPLDTENAEQRSPEIDMRLFVDFFDPNFVVQSGMHDIVSEAFVRAFTATFAGDPTAKDSPIQFGRGEGVRLTRDDANPFGCKPYDQDFEGDAVVLYRGECTFLEKLMRASTANASGVITISDEDVGINPSVDKEDLDIVGDSLNHVAIVVVDRHDGEILASMMDSADMHGGQIIMVIPPLEPQPQARSIAQPTEDERTKARDVNRVLYLNGHPLLNTRLMV
ncbi:hypothetical protein EIP86_007026 [Pleurotus ostreatoroseus]|nr:hypothetical protein EIP86_007026 [Pleurotus ostreatoroseus]